MPFTFRGHQPCQHNLMMPTVRLVVDAHGVEGEADKGDDDFDGYDVDDERGSDTSEPSGDASPTSQ